MYDICIVGAGPAGATLARLVPQGYRTLLVDRRRLDRPAETPGSRKLCGGLLAPAAQHELARQGLGLPARVLRGPQLFAVRAVDLDRRIEQSYQRFYTNVDRDEFDRWLVSLAPACVDTAFGMRATSFERDEDGVTVHVRTQRGAHASVRARIVVGADGANSIVRHELGSPSLASTVLPDPYVAIQAELRGTGVEPAYGSYWSRSFGDFYGWTVPKAGRVLVGLAAPRGDAPLERFEALLAALRDAGVVQGDELERGSAPMWRPSRVGQLNAGSQRVALLGEAAGLLSPSSAEGISYALRSGALLADALGPDLEGAVSRYRRAMRPLVFDVAGKLAKSRAIHDPRVRPLIMSSRIGTLGARIGRVPSLAEVFGP